MSQLVSCKACSNQVAKGAVCPKCGKQNSSGGLLKWIAGGFVLLIAFAIGASAADDAPSATSQRSHGETSAATPPAEPARSPVHVSAQKLFQDYDANEVAADDEYKGRSITVEGRVKSIDKDLFDNVVLVLAAGGDWNSVHATVVDAQKGVAARLRKGQTITAECVGGGMTIKTPMLHDCTLQ